MNECLSLLGGFAAKLFSAVVGVLLALIFSGDINRDGQIKLKRGNITRIALSVYASLFFGQAIIERYDLTETMSIAMQGSIMLMTGVFCLLVMGIFYQAVSLMRGKRLSEVVAEIAEAFRNIWRP